MAAHHCIVRLEEFEYVRGLSPKAFCRRLNGQPNLFVSFDGDFLSEEYKYKRIASEDFDSTKIPGLSDLSPILDLVS